MTQRGQRLMRLYSDLDLVTAEALRTGVLEGLDTAGLAAALSVLVFEARRPDDDAPRVPGGATHEAIEELGRLAGRVHTLERQHRLDFTRQPELGLRVGDLPLGRGRRPRRGAARRRRSRPVGR